MSCSFQWFGGLGTSSCCPFLAIRYVRLGLALDSSCYLIQQMQTLSHFDFTFIPLYTFPFLGRSAEFSYPIFFLSSFIKSFTMGEIFTILRKSRGIFCSLWDELSKHWLSYNSSWTLFISWIFHHIAFLTSPFPWEKHDWHTQDMSI